MKFLLDLLSFLMIILVCDSAFITLYLDGGALDEGLHIVHTGLLTKLPTFFIVFTIITLAYIFFIYGSKYIKSDNIFLFLFFNFIISSLLAEYKQISLFASLNLIICYFLINTQILFNGTNHTLNSLSIIFLIIVVSSILTVFFFPSYGVAVGFHAGDWQGVFHHKNNLGNNVSVMFLFFMWHYSVTKRFTSLIGALLSCILVIGSNSSTSQSAVVICFLLYFLANFKFFYKIIISSRYILVLFSLGLNLAAIFVSLNSIDLSALHIDTKFTGRNNIWEYFLITILDKPILGHGFAQLAESSLKDNNNDELFEKVGHIITTSHNGVIESLYNNGLIGTVLLLLLFIKILKSSTNKNYYSILAISFLVHIFFLNTLESRMIGFNSHLIFLMYLFALVKLNKPIFIKK